MPFNFKVFSDKFWKIVDKINNHRITTLVILFLTYLALWQTGLGGFLIHLVFPEPPINIAVARIENLPFDLLPYAKAMGENGKRATSRFEIFDICGELYFVHIQYPVKPSFLQKAQKDYLQFNYRNLTYSVSVFTDRKDDFELHIYSHNTDFSIEKNIGLVKESGESKSVEGLYEKYVNVYLSKKQKYIEALFNIVPKKEKGDISIECVNEKCNFEALQYSIYLIPFGFNGSITFNIDGKKDYLMDFPKRNFDKITLYYYDYDLQKFFNVSVDEPSSNTYIRTISGASCNPEGKVYVRKNLKLNY